jgi:hypothetical protein
MDLRLIKNVAEKLINYGLFKIILVYMNSVKILIRTFDYYYLIIRKP